MRYNMRKSASTITSIVHEEHFAHSLINYDTEHYDDVADLAGEIARGFVDGWKPFVYIYCPHGSETRFSVHAF